MERVEEILGFWFGDPADPHGEYGHQRQLWFKKDLAFDDTIRRRFLEDVERAMAGELDDWRSQPRSCLALVLLLDQFPRNLFRGSARCFRSDPAALATANYALDTVLVLGCQAVAAADSGGRSLVGSYFWPETNTP